MKKWEVQAFRDGELRKAKCETALAKERETMAPFPVDPILCPKCGSTVGQSVYHPRAEPWYRIAGVAFGEPIIYYYDGENERLTWACACGWRTDTNTKDAQ